MRLAWMVAVLGCGCAGERHAAPKDWQRSIDVERVTSACLPLIGTAGGRSADVPLAAVPGALRDLGAIKVRVSPVDVDIQLGTFTVPPEHDRWGLVCSRGQVSNQFQTHNSPTGTFLIPLGPSLYYYDGVM